MFVQLERILRQRAVGNVQCGSVYAIIHCYDVLECLFSSSVIFFTFLPL